MMLVAAGYSLRRIGYLAVLVSLLYRCLGAVKSWVCPNQRSGGVQCIVFVLGQHLDGGTEGNIVVAERHGFSPSAPFCSSMKCAF